MATVEVVTREEYVVTLVLSHEERASLLGVLDLVAAPFIMTPSPEQKRLAAQLYNDLMRGPVLGDG